MDGASDDQSAPPDSWEMADLDASMSRLLVSSKKVSSSSSLSSAFSSPPEPAEEAPPASERPAGVGMSEDLVNKVDQFLREALEKPRERLAILRMEQEVEKFIRDPAQQQLEFQAIPTSYLRLAGHRVAQHYYLQSVAIPDNSLPDGSGSRILLRKTSLECRLPPIRLADVPVNMPQDDNNVKFKVAIKQRPDKRSQILGTANNHSSKLNHQKSVEERKEDYNRARARIFNTNSNSSSGAKSDDEIKLPDSLHDCSFVSSHPDEKPFTEGFDNYNRRVSGESASGSSRSSKTKLEKDPIITRPRSNSRVAIFRDREVDRKDPDYNRGYDRYMQRFDPGFGFNGNTYGVQALYAPAVNYNTEFPQLGTGQRSPIHMDHPPRSIHQHRPWSTAQAPGVVNYGPPDGMMSPFGPNPVGAHSNSSIFVHSSQYPVPQRPGVTFVHPHEHIQSFTQAHQQHHEASFGLARPR